MFILVNCAGGLTPDDLPIFETLDEALANLPEFSPEYDTTFVMEVTGSGTEAVADVVYVLTEENTMEDSEQDCPGGCGRQAGDCRMWEDPDAGICGDIDED